MTLNSYFLFLGASVVLVLVPGPDMLFMLGRSVAQGRKAGVVAAFGINAGAYLHLLAAVTGLSTILLTSAVAFTVVKWAGAAYLIYLGVRTLLERDAGTEVTRDEAARSLKAVFLQGFLSDALNPKVAIFFLALLPQFVSASGGHAVGQLLLLGVTFNVIAIVMNLLIVVASATISRRLRSTSNVGRWLHKAMGIMFIGLGARLATEKI